MYTLPYTICICVTAVLISHQRPFTLTATKFKVDCTLHCIVIDNMNM